MNAQPLYAETPLESDQEISDALVLLYKLPDEALDSIHESRRTLGLSFVEAALHTGLVSQHELEEAQDWARRQSLPGSRSIVEEALRRRSNTREVVVWEGERLVPGKELVLAHDPYGVRSEAIRSLRTELLMRTNSRRGAAIFAFVSAAGGEGRSQLCAELALAFAQLGSRTLLVDADMRSPRQHLLFGADNQIGLAQALAEGGSGRAYRVDSVPQMDLMTSGATPPNPLELLSGPRFEKMVAEWRRAYEFVLIDTPPSGRFSDGLPVATAAGSVVLLGRANTTTFKSLTELRRRLDTTHARIVGAVINRF